MEMCEAAKRILDTPAKVVYYRGAWGYIRKNRIGC